MNRKHAQIDAKVAIGTTALTRHLDGANFAFADGHVKWFKGSQADTTCTSPSVYNAGVPAQDSGGRATFSID